MEKHETDMLTWGYLQDDVEKSNTGLSNKMGNSLLAVRDIDHKYVVIKEEFGKTMSTQKEK